MVLEAKGHIQVGVEETDIKWFGNVQVERLFSLAHTAGPVFRRNDPVDRQELRVDRVEHEIVNAVLAEVGTHVVGPAVEQRIGALQVLQRPAQAEGDAPVLHVAAEAWGEAARKLGVEHGAMVGQRHVRVIGRRVLLHFRAAAGQPVFEQISALRDGPRVEIVSDVDNFVEVAGTAEHPVARIGIPEVEAALDLALRIVTEGIHAAVDLLQVQAQVAEKLVVVLNLGRSPDLRRRPTHIHVTGLDQTPCVAALYATAGFVHVIELEAEVGEAILGQRHPEVGGHVHLVAVAVVVLAVARLHGQTLGVLPEPEVQHAGNSVRAVLGRGSVAQHLNALQGNGRDVGDIGPL